MKSTALMEEVKAELHLSESASSLKGKVVTSSENESEIINVAVQDHDPAKAAEIANTLVNKFEKEVDERMNVQGVHILSEAKASESPMINRPGCEIWSWLLALLSWAALHWHFFCIFSMIHAKAHAAQRENRIAMLRLRS